jgi:hypothetical protein
MEHDGPWWTHATLLTQQAQPVDDPSWQARRLWQLILAGSGATYPRVRSTFKATQLFAHQIYLKLKSSQSSSSDFRFVGKECLEPWVPVCSHHIPAISSLGLVSPRFTHGHPLGLAFPGATFSRARTWRHHGDSTSGDPPINRWLWYLMMLRLIKPLESEWLTPGLL